MNKASAYKLSLIIMAVLLVMWCVGEFGFFFRKFFFG